MDDEELDTPLDFSLLVTLIKGQKELIWSLVFNFVAASAARTDNASIVASGLYLFSAALIISGVMKTGTALGFGAGKRLIFGLSLFVPVVNLGALVFLNRQANRILHREGYVLGLLGARAENEAPHYSLMIFFVGLAIFIVGAGIAGKLASRPVDAEAFVDMLTSRQRLPYEPQPGVRIDRVEARGKVIHSHVTLIQLDGDPLSDEAVFVMRQEQLKAFCSVLERIARRSPVERGLLLQNHYNNRYGRQLAELSVSARECANVH
jgi:hypothetical protein